MKRILLTAFVIMTLCLLTLGVSAATTECTTHTFESAVITTAPACTTDGVLTYTCSACQATETRVITARHTYHAETTTKPTCEAEGVLTHTCSCGDSYTEVLPMHTYGEGVVTTPASCETDGVMTYTCISCKTATKTEPIKATHTYTNLVELYAPSCFFEGAVQFDCSKCGETGLTASVDKTHEYETTVITQGSCTVEGVIRHTCKYCGTSHKDVTVAKHTYDVLNGNPTSIYYADYTSTGVKYYTCDNCDSTEGVIANPIFTFVGYSATDYDASVNSGLVEITCGYTVDADALAEYHTVMGTSALQYGVVGAVESHLGEGVAPLVSSTAAPVDVANEDGNFIVKRIPFSGSSYSMIDAKLVNIDYNNHTTYFYLALYIFDGSKTVYISDDSCREVPLPISYAMLVDGDGSHDSVTTNTVTFGNGITYSTVEGTQPTQARLDLIASSSKAYKSEEESADSAQDEDTIASIGSLGSWAGTVPNANELLNYYLELGGDATHYRDLDIASLITESTTAKTSWQTSINNILRAAELMAIPGETVNIDQTTETAVNLPSSNSLWSSNRDWYLSFIDGLYYTDTDLNNLTVTEVNGVKTYSAQIVYTVIDYYSFYQYKDDTSTQSFLLWGPTKQELAQLHLDGSALDFLIESTVTYNVSWTEGERPVEDEDFGTIEGFENETYTSGNTILTVVTE